MTRWSGSFAATDAIIASSYACTIAAPLIVRTAVRAALIAPARDFTCLRLRAMLTFAGWRPLVVFACNMSHSFERPLPF